MFVILFFLKPLYEIRFPLARSVVVYVSIRIFLLKVHWLAYMIYYDWKCDSPMNNLLVVCHNFLKGREADASIGALVKNKVTSLNRIKNAHESNIENMIYIETCNET